MKIMKRERYPTTFVLLVHFQSFFSLFAFQFTCRVQIASISNQATPQKNNNLCLISLSCQVTMFQCKGSTYSIYGGQSVFFFFFHAHISLSCTACRELKQIRNQTLPHYLLRTLLLVYTMFKWQRNLLLAFTLCLFWCLTCSANPSPSSLLTPLNDDSNGVQFMEDVLDMTENQDYCNVSLNDCYFDKYICLCEWII
jgi:hypothetical protein